MKTGYLWLEKAMSKEGDIVQSNNNESQVL